MPDSQEDAIPEQLLDAFDECGMLCWNRAGEVQMLSKGFTVMTGISLSGQSTQINELWNQFRSGCDPDPGELSELERIGETQDVDFNDHVTAEPRTLRLKTRQLGALSALLLQDVTELHKAQNEGNAARDLLHGIFWNLPDATVITDPQRRIQHINRAMFEVFGYREHELLGQTTRILYASAQEYEHQGQRRFNTGAAAQFEPYQVEYRRASGETFIGETVGSPIRDRNGTVLGYMGLMRDISARLQGEKALKDNLNLLEGIFRQLPVALAVVDEQRRIMKVSDAAVKMVGLEVDELIGQTTRILYPDEDTYQQVYGRLYPPQGAPVRTHGRRANGECFDAEITMATLLDENNQTQGYMAAITDVTEHLRQQQELKRYERIVNSSRDGLLFIDPGFHYAAVNDAYLALWHTRREQVVGRPVSAIVGQELFERTIKPRLQSSLQGRAQSFIDTIEVLPGEHKTVEATYTPYRDHNGKVEGIVVNIRNITQRLQDQLAIQEHARQLDSLLRAVPVGIGTVKGRILQSVNPQLCEMLGYSRDELLNRSSRMLYFSDADFERVGKEKYAMLHETGIGEIEIPMRHRDGHAVDIWLRSTWIDPQRRELGTTFTVTDITERKRASQEIYTLSQIVEQSPDAVLLTDEQFRITYINPAFESLFGWSFQELQGRTPDILNAEENAGEYQRALYDRIVAGEAVSAIAVNRRKDGSLFDCEFWVSARRDSAGRIIGYMGSQRDVSERQKGEQAQLKLMQERDVLLNNSPALIIYKDRQNNIIRVTESVAQATGLPRDQIEGRHSSEVYPEMADRYYQDDLEVMRSGEPKRAIIEPLPLPDGTTRWLSTDKIPHRDEHGKVDGIIVFAVDITDIKHAELALRESEHKYRTLFQRIAQGVVIHGSNGQILDCNPAAESILGFSREQLLDMSSLTPTWHSIHEDGSDYPGDTHPVMQALRLGKPAETVVMGVFNPRKDDYVWLSVDAVPLIHEGQQRPFAAFASFSDITEARDLQRALIQSQKLEAVGRLTGGIAHDFNNILGGVLGFADLARRRNANNDEKIQHYLKQIETAGLRARDLVRQLLIYSRGERTGEIKSVPMAPMIKEIMKLLRPTFPSNIAIETNVPEQSLSILVDPLHLHQILMNLCLNAKSAMPDGGVLKVSVGLAELSGETCAITQKSVRGQWVEMSVMDSGCGIQAAQQELLFQPFYTTKPIGEGSGMGLAVVAGLLRTYHGHVLVKSEPGQGAEFRVLFPPVDLSDLEIQASGSSG